MKDRKYIYYVECKIASNTWLTKFFVTCNDVDKILPMLESSNLDNTDAWGKPKEPMIVIHQIQRFALCGGVSKETTDSVIEMYRMYCDIKPNDSF